jgi:transposase
LVETAKVNGIEPLFYLKYIFENIPLAYSKQALEKLLPWNIDKEELIP